VALIWRKAKKRGWGTEGGLEKIRCFIRGRAEKKTKVLTEIWARKPQLKKRNIRGKVKVCLSLTSPTLHQRMRLVLLNVGTEKEGKRGSGTFNGNQEEMVLREGGQTYED